MRNGDARWGEYNRKSSEYLLAGEWENYKCVRFLMFLQLLEEKRYLDSFLMLAEVFLYCLNGDVTPCYMDSHIQYAQAVYAHLNLVKNDLARLVLDRLYGQYTPYKTFSANQVTEIYIAFASGNNEKAKKIFIENCPDARAWLRKIRKNTDARLVAQDQQLQQVQEAESRYKSTKDIDWYVDFWESIWDEGGLLFFGIKWWFTLPDLYFKQKRYDDVIAFCEMVKDREPYCIDKADKYIQKAIDRKLKQKAK